MVILNDPCRRLIMMGPLTGKALNVCGLLTQGLNGNSMVIQQICAVCPESISFISFSIWWHWCDRLTHWDHRQRGGHFKMKSTDTWFLDKWLWFHLMSECQHICSLNDCVTYPCGGIEGCFWHLMTLSFQWNASIYYSAPPIEWSTWYLIIHH